MKKFVSAFTASVLAVSAIPTIVASADEQDDVFSVSTEVLTESITVEETFIPAGSVAITVSISNNTGFSTSSTRITLGDAYDVILSNSNSIVLKNEDVIEDACSIGRVDVDSIFVTTASAFDNTEDGKLFTFYASENDENDDHNIEITENSAEDVETILSNSMISLASTPSYFCIGDIDNDGSIDAADATLILQAISINNNAALGVTAANNNLSYYFPYAPNIVCSYTANALCNPVYADPDDDGTREPTDSELYAGVRRGMIKKDDAMDVLCYYSCAATAASESDLQANYRNESSGYCGRTLFYTGS